MMYYKGLLKGFGRLKIIRVLKLEVPRLKPER